MKHSTKASLTDCREIRLGIALQPFFVTGLPRSRTAWLANLFTTDTTLCFHDMPFSIGLVDSTRLVGFSGPQICKQFNEVQRFFPMAPWLVVLRDKDEALESFRRVAGSQVIPLDFWEDRCHLLSTLCGHHQSRVVKFDDLDNESEMRSVWAHLLPGIPFDSVRFQMLCKLNVQQEAPA